MRILHVTGGEVYGGIERMLAALSSFRGAPVEQAFAVSPRGRLWRELTSGGAAVVPLPTARASQPVSVVKARRAFRRLVDEMKADAAVFHGSWTHAMFASVARQRRVRVAFWQHAPIIQPHWPDRWAALTPPDVVIANSRFTASAPAFRDVPVRVIHCPVVAPPAMDARTRAAGRAALGANPDDVVVLMAARMEAWKGHRVLVDALQLAACERLKVWIAGGVQRPGEERYLAELQGAAAAAGVADSISWLGEREDVPVLMRLADIYCQPNTAPEPFGIAIAEGMLAGLPCIVANAGGAAELVAAGCGVPTAPGDAAAVASALAALANDGSARASMGRAAIARAERLTDPAARIVELAAAIGGAEGPDAEHLVCVTTSGALGGAETSLLTLLDALRAIEPRWRVTVLAPADGPLLDRCRASGIGVDTVPYPPAIAALGETSAMAARGPVRIARAAFQLACVSVVLWPYLRRLGEALRRHQATIVHSNGIKAHVAAALALPRGARLVWHLHEYVRARPSTARLLRNLSPRPSAIVVNSDSVADDVRAAFGGSLALHRVHNAVDVSVFRPDGATLDLAAAAGLRDDPGAVRIGLVATFGRWKGHEVFLEAIARLAADRHVRAYVIGGPVYQTAGSQRSLEELRARAAALGLSGTVGFTGHVDDVPGALRALDIVVHASTSPEPFGMVIAEAMAAGRAVVAVRAGGALELFEEGVDALGHEMGDAEDLARQLRRLVDDPALRQSLGRAARAAATERFSARRMALEFRQVYAG